MAARFHFDLENGEETIRDEEGVEAADLEEALDEARAVIRDFRRETHGTLPADWILVIRDEAGAVVGRLPV